MVKKLDLQIIVPSVMLTVISILVIFSWVYNFSYELGYDDGLVEGYEICPLSSKVGEYMEGKSGFYLPSEKIYCISVDNKTAEAIDYVEEHEECHYHVGIDPVHYCKDFCKVAIGN